MTVDRFAILTYLEPADLLNNSTDAVGRPGDWKRVIPGADKIISVIPLPHEEHERYPNAFRLLITYRTVVES